MESERQENNSAIQLIDQAFSDVLPGVFTHQSRSIENAWDLLPEQEQDIAVNFSKNRLREFTTSRAIAHNLIHNLSPNSDAHKQAISLDEDGCPQWPEGFVGSITHTKGICSVAVGRAQKTSNTHPSAIGIDIETQGRLSVAAKSKITSEAERFCIEPVARDLGFDSQILYTIVFSAKEAFYKYQFPLTGLWLNFKDAEIVEFNPTVMTVHVPKLENNGEISRSSFKIHYQTTQRHVVTAAWNADAGIQQ